MFVDTICPVCGKLFYPTYQYTYKLVIKNKTINYCSYKCYRKVQKELEANTNLPRRVT